jgi:hypothetical protein
MPGTFSKSNRPKRPGAYVNFSPTPTSSVPVSAGLTSALFITHDWGPHNAVTECVSFADFQEQFGYSDDTAGYKAVRQAFTGEGVPGHGGSSRVLVYRATNTGVKASLVLQNTTPANAVTLTAKYQGTRGNALKVTVQNYATDAAYTELILKDGTVEVERYRYLDASITDLVTAINGNSDWVTATAAIDSVALGVVSDVSLASGSSGITLVNDDYVLAFAAFETWRFGVFAAENLTNSTTITALSAWVTAQNAVGKRIMAVVGGAAGELISDANTRSTGLNSPFIVNIGVGSVVDSTLGASGAEITLSTAELAPRIAGILASRGETQSLTFARLADVTIASGPTDAEILQAFDAGTVVLSRDSNSIAPVRIEKGLTTWTTTTDVTKPYLLFRNPKFVRTMQGIDQELTQWAEENVIGLLSINDDTREYVVATAKTILDARVKNGAIQEGYSVAVDKNPPPTDQDEFIGLVIGISFGRSLEQLYFSINIS